MKRFFTFLFLLVFIGSTYAQQVEKQIVDRNGNPTFVKFDTKVKSFSKSETKDVLSSIFNMTKSGEYKSLRSEKDQIGYTHERFQQYYKGIKVEKGVYIVHSREGVIESLSGEHKLIEDINTNPSISATEAIEKAKSFVNAEKYMWEQEKAYTPEAELVIVEHDYGKHPKDKHEMVLAYKTDIYATKPLRRDHIYVDAQTGEIVHVNAIIKTAEATGTADTRYSGTKSISTDSYNGSYRLRDYSRGNGIITYNCNESTNYNSAVDFTDNDNNWTAAEYDNADKDNGALDAHWAGMVTYDYFQDVHNRNSFDNNNALIKTYVHYDSNYDNAYWNGSVFTFGDGSSFDILTSLDVFGHEFGHAVCSYTCDLTYSAEPGALNEAFSDIWGCAIEYKYAPEKDTWLMGEDLGSALRSISDPKSKGLPDTYKGDNWWTSSSDYYGVHTNNGPFCYWFYLISVGGSGTNDNNDAYNVTAIGIEKAEQIAYRIESVYMTSSSDYADARTYAIQAAQDLYGEGSQEEISVTDAMYAIGVGDPYNGGGPQPATYCGSEGSDFSYEWIAEVTVGSYTNSSNASGYTDFTNEVIDVNAGETYSITLTPGFASTTYDEYWKIWIDFDNDTTFDAEELVFDAGALSKEAVSGTIDIPTGVSGVRRMRVSMKYNGAQDACETFSYGEVEDYHVNISESGEDTQAPTAPTNLSSSNITETSFTLSWNASTDNVGVTGYDVYQNGSLIGSVTGTSANITGLTASTSYSMTVKAKDAAGNVSAASSALNVTTATPADTEEPTAPSNLSSSNITTSSVALSWSASADNVAVTGYDIYKDGAYLASASGTSYTATGLAASTTYEFYVKAKDAAGNVSAASNTISVTTGDIVAEYCTSQGNNSSYEWIAEVGIGTYGNTSGAAGYTDFTSENITLEAGSSVNVSLTPGFSGSTYNEYWKIWIDYNGDADFDDANELVFDAGSLSKTTVTGTINVLATASGSTRMRVSMKYNAAQTACESFSYGEVEDYTVTFGEAVPDTEAPTVPTGLASSNITTGSATISWNASTDNVGVTGYDVYQNGSFVNTVSGTSYTATGLTAATTYTFAVRAKDAAGNNSALSSSINVTTSDEQLTYCSTKGNNVNYEWIDLVQLNEIDNTTSKDGGYADYTNLTANVALGSSQTIYFSCGFASSSYTEYWHVWIDWDHSGTFDTDEEMVSGSSSSSGTLSANFTVPSDALLGTTRMRVTMKYNSAASPCETFSYGEVEDYTVNVTSSAVNYFFAGVKSDAQELGNEDPTDITVYPNPATSDITVSVVNGTKRGTISIYNVIGSLIKVVEIEGNEREINISDLPSGSYIISVEDEKEPTIKQFIKR